MSGVHPITYTHTPKAPSFSTQKLHIGCDLAAHRLGNISQVVVIAVKRSHLPGKKLINDMIISQKISSFSNQHEETPKFNNTTLQKTP
jgi:hypothetical protein